MMIKIFKFNNNDRIFCVIAQRNETRQIIFVLQTRRTKHINLYLIVYLYFISPHQLKNSIHFVFGSMGEILLTIDAIILKSASR